MYIGLTEEQERLQQEVRDYYKQLLTPEVRAKLVGSGGISNEQRKVVRQMGEDGWLGVGWPEEWGGRGFSAVEQFIWFDESIRAGAPVPMLTINTVGPTIMNYGSDEQKEFFLPKILKGEIHFCIGYSEPGAGTDLAALQTKAERDGDEYIINGQKMWTSLASEADYVWLAVRTNPNVKKHKGISLFVIPMDTPGIKVLPINVMGETDINQVFYEDVRVPATTRVGEENEGWRLITNQLNHERVTLCSSGIVERALTDVREWAQESKLADGSRVIDQEWVQINLARVHARLEFLRLINWKIASEAAKGALQPADASATKVFGTEFYLEAFRLLMEILGQNSYLKDTAPGAVLQSRLEHSYRGLIILTFGGGVNEVQRDLIAVFGLGMPWPRDRENGATAVDFAFNEEQQDLQGLATQILEGELTHERLKEVEGGDENFDRELWAKLAEAGVLGIALPESQGGGGYGFLESALVLEQIGRTVAPIPYYATTIGALPIARFGSDAQQAAILPGVVSGETILSAALTEAGTDPLHPVTTAKPDSDGWVLDGVKDNVPAGPLADRVLVPARTADGKVIVAIVDPTAKGVTRERQDTTNQHAEARLTLESVKVAASDVLGSSDDGEAILAWTVERATAALCAIAIGLCEEAVKMTAEYTKTREQFDRPIATFQAVGQRAADAYIDTEAVRLTAWQAIWRLSEDLPASTEVAVAKFWAADGGQRVVHAAQHLHGGMGVDRDYPLHRYFLWAKTIELGLGGATRQLLTIGKHLADEPVSV